MGRAGVDFFIIGAQKSGTSWLHHQLQRHDQVWMPHDKDPEIHLTTQHDCQLLKHRQSQSLQPGILRGDCNAAYFWTTSAIESSITSAADDNHHFNNDIVSAFSACVGNRVKIIVLLRDPVDRAISAYLHHIGMHSLDPSVAIIDAPATLGIISMGFYAVHLRQWLQGFAPEQMLLLPAPTADNTDPLLNRLSSFLQINGFAEADNKIVFPGMSRQYDEDGIWINLDHPAFALNPPAAGIPRKHIAGACHARLISAEQVRLLQTVYGEHNEQLSELIGQHWSLFEFPFLSAWA